MLSSTLRSLKATLVRRQLPLSSRRLLLAALCLLVALMGAMLAYTSRQLEALTTETLAYADRSLAVADDVQRLQDLTLSMERSARQYLILGDPRLLHDVGQALTSGRDLARRIGKALSTQEALLGARWITLGDQVAATLRRTDAGADRQAQRLSLLFRELGEANQQIERASRMAIQRGAETFTRDMAHQRQTLLSVGVWVALGSIASALMLGLWLSWLFDALAAAIANLGEPKPAATPPIGGPTDMHALAQRINAVRQTLEALENDKELFMRHISHELKTPLANLREGIALLEDRVTGELNSTQERVVGILSANADTLHQQIDDLLQYNASVFAAGRLALGPVDLIRLLHEVLETQRLRCEARGIRVAILGSARPFQLDAEKIRVVLSNLLANAIHFSPDGGQIRFLVAEAGESLHIDCIDAGCGIAPEDRERIFDPFYQGRRQVPALRKGTGIGLSIVRQLVNAHRGQIRVADSNAGAHFQIELPRHPE